jgi:hypothetical protein
MRAREYLRPLGVFVLVVALVVGGTGVAGFATDSTREYSPVENEQFRPSNLLVAESAETGTVEMDADVDGGKTVVVDMAHDNAVAESDLDPLTSALVRNGHAVHFHRQGSLNESLRRADAYVVASPRRPFTPEQMAGIRAFVDAGGRLLLLSEPPRTAVEGGLFSVSLTTVGDTNTGVASEHGLAFDDGYLYDLSNERHFKRISAEPTAESDLTEGVDRLVLREPVPVVADGDATVVAGDVGETTLSTSRRADDHALVARNGGVVAVGDTDFVRSENAYEADNEVFVGNLADFLVGGDKAEGAPKPPDEGEPRPPGAPGPRPAPPTPGDGGSGGEPTPAATETATTAGSN